MADDFTDDRFPDDDSDAGREHAAAVQPVGTKSRTGMSGWAIAGIVALCTVPVLCCVGMVLVSLLLPAARLAQSQNNLKAAPRAQSQNNLKQIGLAAHNFHSTYSAFPPHTAPDGVNLARADDPENPRMAWMTAMLPFMDQQALYGRVDPSLAYDDPAAAGVYGTVVPTYLSPSAPSPTAGPGPAPAHYAGNELVLGADRTGRIRDLTDGTSNTILAAEVNALTGSPAAWGDPDNLRATAAGLNTATGFGGNHPGVVLVLMADGSVRTVSEAIAPATLDALGTPDGGETVNDF